MERTFRAIDTLFRQHLPGYTGSDAGRRGTDVEREPCFSVARSKDLLDEWLVHQHHRPHEGLRHPVMPRVALTPNRMWAALVAVAGYVPVPLSGGDYLELLPVRWQAVTERGIRLDHRTYDHEVLGPYRGQSSGIVARGGKWKVHHNPHDGRRVWIRLPDGESTEIPWIHRDHVNAPFDERTRQHLRATAGPNTDADIHEANLAGALDGLMRRARTGGATRAEQRLLARGTPTRIRLPGRPAREGREQDLGTPSRGAGEDSLDELDESPDASPLPGRNAGEDDSDSPAPSYTGYGLYDAHEEALKWRPPVRSRATTQATRGYTPIPTRRNSPGR
ncbi:Mu transposase C-terminal domain-containing protein [Embleya sp. MST-111070]|uniref:Mu transposase C-terminal domain-containing protein n=1 Tax=Embleya sp. MST-111070 TaxID=3398231 RepID=UPI003F736A5A